MLHTNWNVFKKFFHEPRGCASQLGVIKSFYPDWTGDPSGESGVWSFGVSEVLWQTQDSWYLPHAIWDTLYLFGLTCVTERTERWVYLPHYLPNAALCFYLYVNDYYDERAGVNRGGIWLLVHIMCFHCCPLMHVSIWSTAVTQLPFWLISEI